MPVFVQTMKLVNTPTSTGGGSCKYCKPINLVSEWPKSLASRWPCFVYMWQLTTWQEVICHLLASSTRMHGHHQHQTHSIALTKLSASECLVLTLVVASIRWPARHLISQLLLSDIHTSVNQSWRVNAAFIMQMSQKLIEPSQIIDRRRCMAGNCECSIADHRLAIHCHLRTPRTTLNYNYDSKSYRY